MFDLTIFCTDDESKSVVEGPRSGSTWSSGELENLKIRVKNGHSVRNIALALGRSTWAIVCKAKDKCLIYLDPSTGNYYLPPELPKPSPEKEITMIPAPQVTPPATIETKVFVQGHDAEHYTDEDIFRIIADLENRIKTSSAILNKPKRLNDLIQKTQDDIDALVSYVDGR
jgi:hypothetical protein